MVIITTINLSHLNICGYDILLLPRYIAVGYPLQTRILWLKSINKLRYVVHSVCVYIEYVYVSFNVNQKKKKKKDVWKIEFQLTMSFSQKCIFFLLINLRQVFGSYPNSTHWPGQVHVKGPQSTLKIGSMHYIVQHLERYWSPQARSN